MTDHTQLRQAAEASLVRGKELAAMSVAEFSKNAELRLAFPSAANPQAVLELLDEIERLKTDYNDLIFQVSQKFKGETRHQTAKRYIASWEGRSVQSEPAKSVSSLNLLMVK